MKNISEPNEIKDATSEESNLRIFNFLKEHSVGVLATDTPDHAPHAAVVYYAVDNYFNLYFTTRQQTKKHDNIKHNNQVMVVVYEESSQTTVQVAGIAEEIHDVAKAAEVFKSTLQASMKTSGEGMPPISKLEAGHYVTYCIKPKQIRMAVFARPVSGGYDMFETIDFKS